MKYLILISLIYVFYRINQKNDKLIDISVDQEEDEETEYEELN